MSLFKKLANPSKLSKDNTQRENHTGLSVIQSVLPGAALGAVVGIAATLIKEIIHKKEEFSTNKNEKDPYLIYVLTDQRLYQLYKELEKFTVLLYEGDVLKIVLAKMIKIYFQVMKYYNYCSNLKKEQNYNQQKKTANITSYNNNKDDNNNNIPLPHPSWVQNMNFIHAFLRYYMTDLKNMSITYNNFWNRCGALIMAPELEDTYEDKLQMAESVIRSGVLPILDENFKQFWHFDDVSNDKLLYDDNHKPRDNYSLYTFKLQHLHNKMWMYKHLLRQPSMATVCKLLTQEKRIAHNTLRIVNALDDHSIIHKSLHKQCEEDNSSEYISYLKDRENILNLHKENSNTKDIDQNQIHYDYNNNNNTGNINNKTDKSHSLPSKYEPFVKPVGLNSKTEDQLIHLFQRIKQESFLKVLTDPYARYTKPIEQVDSLPTQIYIISNINDTIKELLSIVENYKSAINEACRHEKYIQMDPSVDFSTIQSSIATVGHHILKPLEETFKSSKLGQSLYENDEEEDDDDENTNESEDEDENDDDDDDDSDSENQNENQEYANSGSDSEEDDEDSDSD